jgi:type III secretion protein L
MTLHVAPSLIARRISAADLELRLSELADLKDARREAELLLQSARNEATELVENAKRSATETEAAMQQKVAADRLRLMQETEDRVSALRVLQTVDAAKELTRRFDDLTPWISTLVIETAERIVGALEPTDQMDRVLSQALSKCRKDWVLRLRCHPETATSLRHLIDADRTGQGRFSGVHDVVDDDRLAVGDCLLESEAGLIEIGIKAQIEALSSAIGLSTRVEPASDQGSVEGEAQ